MFSGYSIFAVGLTWLDHKGSLRCNVWSRTNIKFKGENPERHLEIVDGVQEVLHNVSEGYK
jgi:hypothetical protein